jgi:hypothetical protein
MADAFDPLPSLTDQVDRLVTLGVPALAGMSVEGFRAAIPTPRHVEGSLLVISPTAVPPSALAPVLQHKEKPGFVVTDMGDVDLFAPIPEVAQPDGFAYVVNAPDRGDDMANWSPDEALPAILGRGRTPLTLAEGIHWLLQAPQVLARNHCFMTIGSRIRKPNGAWDARTPAIWISNGTGRDGADRRNAPKVGWCWAGNRHTWLGFASAGTRGTLKA